IAVASVAATVARYCIPTATGSVWARSAVGDVAAAKCHAWGTMTSAPPPADRVRTRAADLIYEQIRDAILTGRLPMGSRHSIYRLAEEFGVSRTPVRDAILRLADTGLLRIER